ncbi:UPF0193 protein EVG1 homolog [Lasioglossum baleicum]|uniref:UPF0193 protein EVG1 homolog n=1 Tax=Lasioglossum baleicum TaxID=434251 RepID=UPI003FCE7EE7
MIVKRRARARRTALTSSFTRFFVADPVSFTCKTRIYLDHRVGRLEMDRKYQRVEMGAGAFHHPPKAKYSDETKNLIKLLMEESKVTMMQRKFIQDAVDRGEPLPLSLERSNKKADKHDSQYQVLMPTIWKKRTQDMIVKSGAYEREQYTRIGPLPNKEKQKRHLACMMAYGKDMPETPRDPSVLYKTKREPRHLVNTDPIDDCE